MAPGAAFTYGITQQESRLREMPIGPTYNFQPGQQRATRVFRIAGGETSVDKIPQLYKDMCGYTTLETMSNGTKYLSRKTPHGHPHFRYYFFCESLGVRPAPGGAPAQDAWQVGYYDEYEVTATYWVPPYRVLADKETLQASTGQGFYPVEYDLGRYVYIDRKPIAKFQTIPSYGPAKWANNGAAAANVAAYPIWEEEISITHYQIPVRAIPWTAMKAVYGKTNDAAFGSLNATPPIEFATGSLVYGGGQPRYYRMANQEWAADIEHRFRYYPQGANKFLQVLRNTAIEFQYLVLNYERMQPPTNEAAKYLFKTGDYSSLFKPEP